MSSGKRIDFANATPATQGKSRRLADIWWTILVCSVEKDGIVTKTGKYMANFSWWGKRDEGEAIVEKMQGTLKQQGTVKYNETEIGSTRPDFISASFFTPLGLHVVKHSFESASGRRLKICKDEAMVVQPQLVATHVVNAFPHISVTGDVAHVKTYMQLFGGDSNRDGQVFFELDDAASFKVNMVNMCQEFGYGITIDESIESLITSQIPIGESEILS